MIKYLLLVTIILIILVYIFLHKNSPKLHKVILTIIAIFSAMLEDIVSIALLLLNFYAIVLSIKSKEYNVAVLLVFLELLLIYAYIMELVKPAGYISAFPYQVLAIY